MVEIVVSFGIAALLAVSFLGLIQQMKKVARLAEERLRAELYATEAIEALKDLERSSWGELAPCADCHVELVGSPPLWRVLTGPETLPRGPHVRTLTLEDAGPHKKKATVTIRWEDALGEKSASLTAYLFEQEAILDTL
jgi:hypothetical protein